ncbi:hypothetical protein Tco_1070216 [Tanacetum coccineum]|uniref:Uncharacterized protein n=1 Tax=Tanacetum coccineum TaxID=301880 RepID=A0ABQ5HM51_9ASTR
MEGEDSIELELLEDFRGRERVIDEFTGELIGKRIDLRRESIEMARFSNGFYKRSEFIIKESFCGIEGCLPASHQLIRSTLVETIHHQIKERIRENE